MGKLVDKISCTGIANYGDFGDLRYIMVENKMGDFDPWLVGQDVAKILDYDKPEDMFRLIDKEDKMILNPRELSGKEFHIDRKSCPETVANTGSLTLWGEAFDLNTTRLTFINESGLYTAVFSSKAPEAKKFRRWVTSEVLPTIRKYGFYMTPKVEKEYLKSEEHRKKIEADLRRQHLVEKGVRFPEWFEADPIFNKWRDEINEGLDYFIEEFGYKDRNQALYNVYTAIWHNARESMTADTSAFVDNEIYKIKSLKVVPTDDDYMALENIDRLCVIFSTERLFYLFNNYVIDRYYLVAKMMLDDNPKYKVKTMRGTSYGGKAVVD